MMLAPAVSVIIPTYNRAHLILRAVNSALQNMQPGDELIVVDDDSSDGTEQVLSAISQPIVYKRVPHGGAGAARNAGVAVARNPLVAFLDSDDGWMPGKLALQRALMQRRPDLVFCSSDFAVQVEENVSRRYLRNWRQTQRTWQDMFGVPVPYSSIAPLPDGVADFPVHISNFYASLLWDGCVLTSSLVVRRDLAGDALRFPTDLPTYEDWECFARLARVGPAAYLDCETVWQYGHTGPRLTDATRFVRATSRLAILDRVYGRDSQFQADHSPEFNEVVTQQRMHRAKQFLREGRIPEASLEIRQAPNAVLAYRMVAKVPAPLFPSKLVTALLRFRGRLRKPAADAPI